MKRLRSMTHQKHQPPWAPFLLVLVELGDIATSRFLATWMSLIPTPNWGLLAKDGPLDPGTGLFCTVKWNLVHGLLLPPLLGGKDRDKPMEDCCWVCARDQLIWPYIQASWGGITSLRLWRKGNSQHCLETKLNTCIKLWVEFPTHLETALSKMLWTLRSNSHTSDTGIMPPSELGREERVSRRATLRWEVSCSVSRVAWAAAPSPVCKSDRDWSAFLFAEVKVMLSGGCNEQNPKNCMMARKIMNQFGCWHLGSQRHRCKKSPSLAPQFTRSYARRKLQFRIVRKSTNQVKKPRRDWRCNDIKLIQGSIQFWWIRELVKMESKPC